MDISGYKPDILLKTKYPAVTYAAAEHQGRLFWITCKWLKLLRKASRLQVIQNLVPSVVRWRQCDIRIALFTITSLNSKVAAWIKSWFEFLAFFWTLM